MKSKLKIYCLTALFLTSILTALRCLSLFLFYSPEIGYFNNSPVTVIMNALYVVSAAWLFSPLIFIPRESVNTQFMSDRRVYQSGSVFAAVMFVFSFISTVITDGVDLKNLFIAVLFLASALYFVLSALGNSKFDTAKAFLSLLPVLSLILILASLYFDMNIAMNSPHKILGGITLMAAMVFFLCETRIYLGKPMPRLHLASGLTAFMLGASYCVSSIVYLLVSASGGFVSHPITLGSMGYLSVIIGVSVYAISRSFTFEDSDVASNSETALEE